VASRKTHVRLEGLFYIYIFSEFCLPMKLVALINVLNEMCNQDQVCIYIYIYIYIFPFQNDQREGDVLT